MTGAWMEDARQVGLAEVLRALGSRVGPRGTTATPCPQCGAEVRSRSGPKRPPVNIVERGRGWKCWAGGCSGDALAAASYALTRRALARNPRWAEVRDWFAEHGWCEGGALNGTPRRPRVAATPIEVQPPTPRPRPPPDGLAAVWAACGAVDDDEEVARWLSERRLAPAEVGAAELARALPHRLPTPKWAVAPAPSRPRWGARGYRLLLPAYGASGAMESVRARSVVARTDDLPKGLAAAAGEGSATALVLANGPGRRMLETGEIQPGGSDLVLVVEGETDFLSASVAWGKPLDVPVLGLWSGAWKPEIAARVPEHSRLVLWTDADAPGDRYAETVRESLEGRDVRVYRRRPPDGRDVHDLWRDGELPADPMDGALPMDPPSPDVPAGEDEPLLPEVPHPEDDGSGAECAWLAEVAGAECGEPDPAVLAALDMVRPSRGRPYPAGKLSNVAAVLTLDARWRGQVRLNEFDGDCYLRGRRVQDADESGLGVWLDRVYHLQVPTLRVAEAMRLVASRHPYHPVREYLDGLTWDREPRLGEFWQAYFGADPSPLLGEMGWRWPVAAVARIYQPGCKADAVPILVGEQGAGKSMGFRELVPRPQWFSDSDLNLDDKDGMQTIRGLWVQEFGELTSFSRRDANKVKAYITSQSDRFRPAFGRNVVCWPRQTVFVGTTNDDRFLRDPTGSRRFWPVRAGTVDLDAIRRDRDQLWAEAVEYYRRGATWWLGAESEALLAEHSEAFTEVDCWEERIAEWASARGGAFTMEEVLFEALKLEVARHGKGEQIRAGMALRRLGYRGDREQVGGARKTVWRRRGRVIALVTASGSVN